MRIHPILHSTGFCCVLLASSVTFAAQDKTLTFIHLNDLHAHLTPHLDYDMASETQKVVKRGGLARIATMVKQIRADNPNSVLMNIGDTYHGGVEATFTQGNAIVDPVNALGIDVGVPGNWDFAYGPFVTRKRYGFFPTLSIKRPNFPNLAANVKRKLRLFETTFLPATFIKNMDGVKVGFIGLTSDIVPQMAPGLALGLTFLQKETAYIELLERHATRLRRRGAAVVVVMSELGIQKDYRLANAITANSVDVFFSAHTHEATFQPLMSDSGALVVEAGNDTYLGRMDITVNQGKITQTAWQLMPVEANIVPDPEVLALVEHARAPFLDANIDLAATGLVNQHLDHPINTVVAYSEHTLDRRHALENTFNNAFTDSLRAYSGTQIALTPGFRFDSVVLGGAVGVEGNVVTQGQITLEDVYRFFPVSFTLATGKVSGQRLKAIIEENLSGVFSSAVFQQSGGWFDGFSGLDVVVNLANPDGQRVVDLSLTESGETISAQDQLTVTGCTRPYDQNTLCSYSGFAEVTALINPETGEAWTNIDFLIHALQLSMPTRHNIVDENETLLWPQGPFVQPISGAL